MLRVLGLLLFRRLVPVVVLFTVKIEFDPVQVFDPESLVFPRWLLWGIRKVLLLHAEAPASELHQFLGQVHPFLAFLAAIVLAIVLLVVVALAEGALHV